MNAVSIPVMAKARIGHITEARVLEAMGVDYIDESEVLTPADEEYHLRKDQFTVPFVCGCRNLGEARVVLVKVQCYVLKVNLVLVTL